MGQVIQGIFGSEARRIDEGHLMSDGAVDFSHYCPLCKQEMPKTDFTIYPKSMAVSLDGWVAKFGPLSFRIISTLWKHYPNPVPTEKLWFAVYEGTKGESCDATLRSNIMCLRQKLSPIGVRIINHINVGYAMEFKKFVPHKHSKIMRGVA